ncbi:MAG: 1,6-anhydro-N-acetylmuramyl-L-alanine amidase AmpD [Gammaproteobacteria bacterium]
MPNHAALDPISGWFENAIIIPSPNFDYRPLSSIIDLIVIHSISLPPGQFGSDCIERFFKNDLDASAHPYFVSIEELKVSSHFLIERTGILKQFVSTNMRAWHCGESSFNGRTRCNDFSIGIELEGCDDIGFTEKQYTVLNHVLVELVGAYPNVSDERIVGHQDIAPRRKTDPGPHFDWDRTRNALNVQRLG